MAWERYGQEDPYYGVLTDVRYRGKSLDESARRDFFASGEEHVGSVIDGVRRWVDPDFEPATVLDFGCGVGRLVIPFALRGATVHGVDVSESMLREAHENCERAGVPASFSLSDDNLSLVTQKFDLVHSTIVFQHIPCKRGYVILDALLDRIRPGGVGVLHFTFESGESRARTLLRRARTTYPVIHYATNVVRGRALRTPSMQMNSYDVGRIMSMIGERGCTSLHVDLTQHGPFKGATFYFRTAESD